MNSIFKKSSSQQFKNGMGSRKKISSVGQGLLLAGAVIMLVIAGYMILKDVQLYFQKAKLNAQIEDLKKQIAQLESQNQELNKDIAFTDDSQYVETVAREDLGMQSPGETAVSFVVSENEQEENKESKNFLQIWLGWLGGLFSRD